MLTVPSAYAEGYARARVVDPAAAETYLRHTTIGDPVLDPVLAELADLPQAELHRFIAAGIERDADGLRTAPAVLRDFFAGIDDAPAWVDHQAFRPGARAFGANAVPILAAFVAGTLVEGFATLIGKSFAMTGRVMDRGVRRLRQNNRHQVEIFYPGGLRRENDGWKLSVRIRFVHAQVRRLLADGGEWDRDAWGMPISAASLGYAIACFSARTLAHSRALGARYSREQREGYCAVWRYTGHLMGIPETILYTTPAEARRMFALGVRCEPAPSDESVLMANALINSAPLVAGISEPAQRKALVTDLIYPISRALVGGDLADQLRFPAIPMLRSRAILFLYWLDNWRKRALPRMFKDRESTPMEQVFEASLYEPEGITYALPDHAYSNRSSSW